MLFKESNPSMELDAVAYYYKLHIQSLLLSDSQGVREEAEFKFQGLEKAILNFISVRVL